MRNQVFGTLSTQVTESLSPDDLYVTALATRAAFRDLGVSRISARGSLLLWERNANEVVLSCNLAEGPAHDFHDLVAHDDADVRGFSDQLVRSDEWCLSRLAELISTSAFGVSELVTPDRTDGDGWWRSANSLVLRTDDNLFIASLACESKDQYAADLVLTAIAAVLTIRTGSAHYSEFSYLEWIENKVYIEAEYLCERLRRAYVSAEQLVAGYTRYAKNSIPR